MSDVMDRMVQLRVALKEVYEQERLARIFWADIARMEAERFGERRVEILNEMRLIQAVRP